MGVVLWKIKEQLGSTFLEKSDEVRPTGPYFKPSGALITSSR